MLPVSLGFLLFVFTFFLIYNVYMSKYKELTIRYLILMPGMVLLCMGIALLAKAGLGTSPISSIPYSLSLIAPRFSMGKYIIVVNSSLVAAQVLMLHGKPGEAVGRSGGKALPWQEAVIQVLLAVMTGYVVDLSLYLYRGLALTTYPRQLIAALIGTFLMGTGVYIQLIANVAMAPGDAFSRALASVTHQPYGKVRVIADTVMVAIALALCLIFLHRPACVREGTLICALLTGNIVKLYQKLFGTGPYNRGRS